MGELASAPHFRGTKEILTVAQGKLLVRSGYSVTELNQGDSIHYAVDVAHSITNAGETPATAYLLV